MFILLFNTLHSPFMSISEMLLGQVTNLACFVAQFIRSYIKEQSDRSLVWADF